MSRESVSILIPTHNRHDVLVRTIESLRSLRVPPDVGVELAVVMNACVDNTSSMLKRELPSLSFPTRAVTEHEVGLNAARNRCVREATGEILAFLDDDVWVEPGWLEGLLDVYRMQPADMVGGRVHLWWEAVRPPEWMSPIIEDRLSANDHGDQVFEYYGTKLAIGANVSFRRRVFESVGLFKLGLDRTGQNLLGGGETELIQRALNKEFRLFYAPNAVVKHWVSPQRIEKAYLDGVAHAAGQTAIYRLERFGPKDLIHQVLGRTVRLVQHGGLEAWAGLRRDTRTRMEHRSYRAQAVGGFSGIWNRLRGRSPVARVPQSLAANGERRLT